MFQSLATGHDLGIAPSSPLTSGLLPYSVSWVPALYGLLQEYGGPMSEDRGVYQRTSLVSTERLRWNSSLGCVASFWTLLFGLVACVDGVPGHPETRIEHGAGRSGLTTGWTLISGEQGHLLDGPLGQRSVVFAIDQVLSPLRRGAALRYRRSLTLAPGQSYWVYVASTEGSLELDSVSPPDLGSKTGHSGKFVVASNATSVSLVAPTRVFRWDTASQQKVALLASARLEPGRVYWFEDPISPRGTSPSPEAPRPPIQLVAWADEKEAHLRWDPPKLLENGARIPAGVRPGYVVVLEDEALPHPKRIQVGENRYDAVLPEDGRTVVFSVMATLVGDAGHPLESGRSSRVELRRTERVTATAPGTFEAPSRVTATGLTATLPALAVSAGSAGPYTHMAYVARGGGEGKRDRVQYVRSDRLAKGDSWSAPVSVFVPGADQRVTEVAIAAKAGRVLIAWLQVSRSSEGGPNSTSSLYVASSSTGGERFDPVTDPLHSNTQWKQSLGLGIDRLGHSHLVWGEASQALYLKDFQGPPENVFDETKRRVNDEIVRYHRIYAGKGCEGACGCPDPVDESYSLALEPNPKNQDAPFGVYLERVERNYVENPSLHVDDHQISIVVRQTRNYDNLPVRNPNWTGALGPYFRAEASNPSDSGLPQSCPPIGSIARQHGFRHAWKKDPYACAPNPPENGTDLYARERLDFSYTASFASLDDFYSYDGSRPHERDWYMNLYAGRWDETDRIKIASRPIVSGDWSEPKTERVTVPRLVGRFIELREEDRSVETGWAQGAWVDNTLQNWRITTLDAFESERGEAQVCGDEEGPHRGLSGPSLPRLASGTDGRRVVVYEKGTSSDPNAPGGNPIYAVHSSDGGLRWSSPSRMAAGYVPSVALAADGTLAAAFYSVAEHQKASIQVVRMDAARQPENPLLASRKLPAPVHWKTHGAGAENLRVPTVVSYGELLIVAWVRAPQEPGGENHIVTTRSVFAGKETSRLVLTAPSHPVAHQAVQAKLECLNDYHMLSAGCSPATLQSQSSPADVHLASGTVSQTVWAEFSADGRPALASFESTPVGALADGAAFAPHAGFLLEAEPKVDPANLQGNHRRAIRLRDRLYSTELGAQLEYEGDVSESDSRYLAQFDRVWVYTQGIALAQYARQGDARAGALAHFLCDSARSNAAKSPSDLLGWPFSWNTNGDDWADARRVTGANAWAVHGLGVYVTTRAFLEETEEKDRKAILDCYLGALRGLMVHRRGGLMTAGWTTRGLQNAAAPHVLGLEDDAQILWDYYDILDAIGYDDFDSENPPTIERYRLNEGGRRAPLGRHTLTETDFEILRTTTQADNVVTEHNLDQLSVLNHALLHWSVISKHMSPADRGFERELRPWRDELRAGIFHELWEPKEGRFITGGAFLGNDFDADSQTAIDNCSWLALSVDYTSLGAGARDKLSKCLDYTIDHFVKSLEFNGRVYVGTHYFPNSFSDPYIDASDEQEALYHLEATAGLVLGLRRFVDANPDRPEVQRLGDQADSLWRHMQKFVRDNGFPYSSRRIQDLMTLLQSSTAVIWYIDVFDYYAGQGQNLDRPLKNYARVVDPEKERARTQDAWKTLLLRGGLGDPRARFRPRFMPKEEDGLRDPDWGVFESEASPENYRVRLRIRNDYGEGPSESTTPIYVAEGAPPPPITEVVDVPVNITSISVDVTAKKTSPASDDLRHLLNEWGWFDEIHYAFFGQVDVTGLQGGYHVMLSFIMDEEEWFVGETDFDEVTGAFSFSFKKGARGFPELGDVDWGRQVPKPEGVPIARLISKEHQKDFATSLPVTLEGLQNPRGPAADIQGSGFWSFQHRFGGLSHQVEVIDVSQDPPEVVESLWEYERGPLFDSGLEINARSLAFVEEQAWAILAASTRTPEYDPDYFGQVPILEPWMDGLFSLITTISTSKASYAQFPFAVTSRRRQQLPYYRTATQLLSVYALARYLEANGPLREQRPGLVASLVDVLRSIRNLYSLRESDGPLLGGMGHPEYLAKSLGLHVLPPEQESEEREGAPILPTLSVRDHFYAYFAIEAVQRLVANSEPDAMFLDDFGDQIRLAMYDHFWDAQGEGRAIALLRADKDGVITPMADAGSSAEAAALFLWFSVIDGTGGEPRFRRLFEHTLRSQPPSWPTHLSVPREGPSDAPFLFALVRRGSAAFDPRLAELAWLESHRFRGSVSTMSVAELAQHVILENPAGVFGVDAKSMFAAAESSFSMPSAPVVRSRLGWRYLDGLGALLMSDYRASTFDALLHRLVRVRFVYQEYAKGTPVHSWPWLFVRLSYEDQLLETVHRLSYGCGGVADFYDKKPEDLVGVACEDLEDAFLSLLELRLGGDDPIALALEIDRRDDDFELLRLGQVTTASVLAGDEDRMRFGNLDGVRDMGTHSSYAFLARVQRQPLTSGSVPDIRTQLRAHWAEAIQRAAASEDGVYDLDGIDRVSAQNPASPDYWTRTAVEYRLLAHDNALPVMGKGHALGHGVATLGAERRDGASQKNIQALRRFINQHYQGELWTVASRSQLTGAIIHGMMQSGQMTEEAFERVASGARLSQDEIESAKTEFSFVPDPSDSTGPLGEGVGADSFWLHAQLAERGEVLDGVFHRFREPPLLRPWVDISGGMKPLGVVKFKGGTQALKVLARKLDDLLLLPPELSAVVAAVPSIVAYTGSLGLEVDPGLLSLFASDQEPSPEFWEPVGRVRGEDLLAPFGAYLKDEEDIRANVPIYGASDGMDTPLSGPSIRFDDDKIYHITIDFLGFEAPEFGSIGVLDFEEGAFFQVHALRSEHPRSAIINASVRNHLRWKRAAEWASVLPEDIREMFLFWVELSIRSELTLQKAERIVQDPLAFRVGQGDGGETHGLAPERMITKADGASPDEADSANPEPGPPALPVRTVRYEHMIADSSPVKESLEGPVRIQFDDDWSTTSIKGQEERFKVMLLQAVRDVAQFQPKEDNLFSWTGDRSTLTDKSLEILVTKRTDPTTQLMLSADSIRDGLGSFTVVEYDQLLRVTESNEGALLITIGLLLEELAFDARGRLRPDAGVRIRTALAHQIFGGVQQVLKTPPQELPPPPVGDDGDLQSTIQGYEASVGFLKRVIESPDFDAYSTPTKQQYTTILEERSATLDQFLAERKKKEDEAPPSLEQFVPALGGPVRIARTALPDEMLLAAQKKLFWGAEVVQVYNFRKGYIAFPVFDLHSPNDAHPMWKAIESWDQGWVIVGVTESKSPERETTVARLLLTKALQPFIRVVRSDDRIRYYPKWSDERIEALKPRYDRWSNDPLLAYRQGQKEAKVSEANPQWDRQMGTFDEPMTVTDLYRHFLTEGIRDRFPDLEVIEDRSEIRTDEKSSEAKHYFLVIKKIPNKALHGEIIVPGDDTGSYTEVRFSFAPMGVKGWTQVTMETIQGYAWWGRPKNADPEP